MTARPNPARPDVRAELAALLRGHMARTGKSPEAVAAELGAPAALIRSWAAGEADNEFAHLDTPAKFGEWLRAQIAAAGATVRDIADSTPGVSRSTLYNWICGIHVPPPPTGEEPDRLDLVLRNPALDLTMRERIQLDEVRRRLTGTSLHLRAPDPHWPTRGLPAGLPSFTGRAAALRGLDRLLVDYTRDRAAAAFVLTGTGGVGKTALAVHWARSRDAQATFTDGCLYVNLNGYADSPPLRPDDALAAMLVRLGAEPHTVPDDPAAKAAMYQERLAGRRLLVLLDNARDEPQVRPLLPTEPGALAVVTSRNRLDGLAATNPDVRSLLLEPLTGTEARSLLRRLLGSIPAGIAMDPAIDDFARACDNLPLALTVAAANYLSQHSRTTPVSAYAAALVEGRARLAVSATDPNTAVTAALGHSYRHLTADAQRAYRLLGLHPGPAFTVEAAASLIGRPVEATAPLLLELVQSNLLTPAGARFGFHDLLRDHAALKSGDTDAPGDRQAALARLLDHYVHSSYAAERRMNPSGEAADPAPPDPGAVTVDFGDADEAAEWLSREQPALLDAAAHAHRHGFDRHCWQIARNLADLLYRQGRWHDMAAVLATATAAADRMGDAAARAWCHRARSNAYKRLGPVEQARTELKAAVALYEGIGDTTGVAHALTLLGCTDGDEGRHADAIEHHQRAHRLYRRTGHRAGQAGALNAIGWHLAKLGHHAQAVACCADALDMLESLGDDAGEADTLHSLGYAHRHLGHSRLAVHYFRRSIERYRRIGDRHGTATALTDLGDLLAATGHRAMARGAWTRARDVFDELDHPDAEPVRAKLDTETA